MTAHPDVELREGAVYADGRPLAVTDVDVQPDDDDLEWLAHAPMENGLVLTIAKWRRPLESTDASDVSVFLEWPKPQSGNWPVEIVSGRAVVHTGELDPGWMCEVDSGDEIRGYLARWGNLPVVHPELRPS